MALPRRTLGVLACVVFALPLVAAWSAASTPLSLKVLAAAMAVLAASRPRWGLCALAALLPVARFISILADAPFGGEETAEILIVPWLFGATLRSTSAGWPPSRLDAPATVLAVVVAAGAAVGLYADQQATMWPSDYLAALRHHWLNDYFADRATFGPLHNAMPWIEGLALAALAARALRAEPNGWRPVVHALLVGAVANAAFAWIRVIEVATRHDYSLRQLGDLLLRQRTSTLYNDFNAAGSLYALFAVAALWLGLKGGRQWRWGLLAAGVVLLALWITGSRTAFAAAVLGLAAAWLIDRGMSLRTAAIGAGIAGVLLATIILWNPGRTAQSSSSISVDVRVRMTRIAAEIIREHPAFGVGLAKFRQFSQPHVTPDFIAMFPQTARGENAHNNFLQIWAEMGTIGLVVFLWLLFALLSAALSAGADPQRRTAALAMGSGTLAFVLTFLTGHPLLITEILWIFFLIAGVMAGLSTAPAGGRASRWAVVAGVLFVAASVPVRVHEHRQAADLDHVVIGAGPTIDAGADQPYRLAEPRSAWYVTAAWRGVEIPVRATADSQPPCVVEVDLDGEAANVVDVPRDNWSAVTLQFDPGRRTPFTHRIELRVPNPACRLMVGKFRYRE